MGFRIEKLGKYRQRDGEAVRVVEMDDVYAYGIDSSREVFRWDRNSGEWEWKNGTESDYDIVGEWDGPDADPPAKPEPAPLSLRDEIALRILCAWLSNSDWYDHALIANDAYAKADSFLAARDAHNAKLNQQGNSNV